MKSVNYARFFGNYARNPGPESVRQERPDTRHRRRTEDPIGPKECLAIRPVRGSPQETVVLTYPDATQFPIHDPAAGHFWDSGVLSAKNFRPKKIPSKKIRSVTI